MTTPTLPTLVSTIPTAAEVQAAGANDGGYTDIAGMYSSAVGSLQLAVSALYQISRRLPTGDTQSAILAVTTPLIGNP
jgi:hypothetical protein